MRGKNKVGQSKKLSPFLLGLQEAEQGVEILAGSPKREERDSLTTSVSLTHQKKLTIIHALYELIDQQNSEVVGLAKRLQCALSEGITGLELSKGEIDYIIIALELALKKTRDRGAERYGPFLSIIELEKLTDDIRDLSKIF